MTQTSQFLINHGLLLVFAAVLMEQMGLPLPAPPWLLAAGALSATGQFSFPLGVDLGPNSQNTTASKTLVGNAEPASARSKESEYGAREQQA